ncbi:MAG: glycosyltransferase [Acidobacteriota bacterium]
MPESTAPPYPTPRVAVIIAVYNGAADIAECIHSVLAQTLPAAEILVIDDGSQDNSAAIASSIPGVKVFSIPNAGVSEARNWGLRLATAEWVAFLDHDDVWMPDKLEKQMQLLAANPEASACATGTQAFRQTAAGRVILGHNSPMPRNVDRELQFRNIFTPSTVVVRREFSLSVGGFDNTLRSAEDWDHWLALSHGGCKFIACPEPLVAYRMHATNISNDSVRMYNGEMQTFERRIAPRLHPLVRPFRRRFMKGVFLAGVALSDRPQNLPCLGTMLRSLLACPVGHWVRYRILAVILLDKVRPHRSSDRSR